MQVRDRLNTAQGYQEIIDFKIKAINESYAKINSLLEDEKNGIQKFPKPNPAIIKSTEDNILRYKHDTMIAKYSQGINLEEIRVEYLSIVPLMVTNWKQSNGYVQMVEMLSIGLLLEIDQDVFIRLVELVQNDNPNDFLIDFLINTRVKNWEQHTGFKFSNPYSKTKDIVNFAAVNGDEGLDKLVKYLRKDWFRGIETKTHLSKFNIHSGYWSFESGALAKILGLDDYNLRDQKYYPYDMVHWKN